MTKLSNKSFFVVILIFSSLVIYWRWSLPGIFVFGDWSFAFSDTLRDVIVPSVWVSHFTIGQVDPILFRLPIDELIALTSHITNWDSNVLDKFFFFWPQVILLPLSAFFLIRHITKHDLAAFVGAIVFSFNTYFLAIDTQGHNLITISSAFCIFGLYFTILAFDTSALINILFAILFFAIGGFYDFRILYLSGALIAIFSPYLFSRTSFKNSAMYFCTLGLGIFFLNIFWFLPIPSLGSDFANRILNRSLFGDQFWSLLYAIVLMHPFWSGIKPDWFVTQPIPIYFWLTPVLAIAGFITARKNMLVGIFGVVAVLGIFLTKQSGAPFESIYLWLFKTVPGFNAFREASKFYFYISLSYSVLIAFFVCWIWQFRSNHFTYLSKIVVTLAICFVFLWNSYPIITGGLGTMFVSRTPNPDYFELRSKLNKDNSFFRSFWLPRASKWIVDTSVHPVGSGIDLLTLPFASDVNGRIPDNRTDLQLSALLNEPYASTLLNAISVKYIGVPIQDFANDDDFFQFYGEAFNPSIRQWYINELDKLPYLKRIDIGTKNLVVYENKGYKPYISAFTQLSSLDSMNNLDLKYNFISNTLRTDFTFALIPATSTLPAQHITNIFENITTNDLENGSLNQEIVAQEGSTLYTPENTINQSPNDSTMLMAHTNASTSSTSAKSIFYNIASTGNFTLSYSDPSHPFVNLVNDPSFESGLWSDIVGDCNNYDTNPELEMRQGNVAADGSSSLELEATRHIACTSQSIAVAGGNKYFFSFKYQSPNADNAGYYIGFAYATSSANSTSTQNLSEQLPIHGNEWHEFDKIIDVPASVKSLTIFFYSYEKDGVTPIVTRYDDVHLVQVPDDLYGYWLVSKPLMLLIAPKQVMFTIVNPTKKLVHVSGATTPFYLAMSEAYHPQWRAEFANAKVSGKINSWVPWVKPDQIPNADHFELDGFLNGWYIDTDQYCKTENLCTRNADGTYDMDLVIEFVPQRWFYVGLIISAVTLITLLGYIFLSFDFVRTHTSRENLH